MIGSIGVFDTGVRHWESDEVHVVQALAHVATIGLLQERAIRRGEVLAEQLQSALNSRIVIEQAKGAIAQFRNVSVDDAFVLLRDHARRTNSRLGEVAQACAITNPRSLSDPPLRAKPIIGLNGFAKSTHLCRRVDQRLRSQGGYS